MYWWTLPALLLPFVSYAWNADGHRIVARIAASRIRNKTKLYLKEHLGIESPGRKHYALMTYYSTWADSVEWSNDLHFVSLRGETCDGFNMERDCGSDGTRRCIVTAIGDYTERASDVELEPLDRAEAIRFLLHFVADSHQPLHTGFASDRGGTGIKLTRPTDHSLHEVWDSYLLSRLTPDWRSLATELIESSKEINIDNLEVRDLGATEWASEIVSETIRRHTCTSAYQENESGPRIVTGASLSEKYIKSRMSVVKSQLSKAGIRLAHVLDYVASEYYRKERMQTLATDLETKRSSSNIFDGFLEVDLEEVAFELDSDPEDEIEETGVGATRETAAPVVTKKLPTPSPQEKNRLRNRKKAEKKKVTKRMLFGVDLDSVVLIKRGKCFYITYRKFVTSDTFTPERVMVVKVRFTGEQGTVSFLLDGDVFSMGEPPAELLHAIFGKLRGEAESCNIGQARDFAVVGASDEVKRSGVEAWLSRRIPNTDYTSIELSSVRDMIAHTPSDAELHEKYGAHIPSRDQLMWDAVQRVSNDIVGVTLGNTIVISLGEYLKDTANRRWVFNLDSLLMSSVSAEEIHPIFIDARIVDGVLSNALIMELIRIAEQPDNTESLLRIMQSGCPILERLSIMETSGDRDRSISTVQILMSFESRRRVKRTDGVSTEEFVLRTMEDEEQIRQMFPFVPPIRFVNLPPSTTR